MAAEKKPPPVDAEELLARYAAGERVFGGATLFKADLRGADLRGARLSGADLRGANLTGVNLTGADLVSANLSRALLGVAWLRDADLRDADLGGANLGGANLGGANLRDANLGGANLFNAHLHDANLCGANLGGANLSKTHLRRADFSGADLSATDLSGARLGGSILADLDLSPFCDVNLPLKHETPSIIDHRSILKSIRSPNLKDFLLRAGIPELMVESMVDTAMALGASVFAMMRSTFISHGSEDEPFATALYEALHRSGVRTFYAPRHTTPGEPLHRELHTGIAGHDRTILICSRRSLDRPWVLYEIEAALRREARDGGATYLIPVRLDDYLFHGWNPPRPDLAQALRDRVVADFEGADQSDEIFRQRLGALLRALRKIPEPLSMLGP
jgi:hypothetical protein